MRNKPSKKRKDDKPLASVILKKTEPEQPDPGALTPEDIFDDAVVSVFKNATEEDLFDVKSRFMKGIGELFSAGKNPMIVGESIDDMMEIFVRALKKLAEIMSETQERGIELSSLGADPFDEGRDEQ